jgi:dephospho-CoA kinase
MLPAERGDQPYLIGITGPSGSGKTELSRRLAARLPAGIVSLDSYYRELLSTKVFIAAEDRVCFERRRPVPHRGPSA